MPLTRQDYADIQGHIDLGIRLFGEYGLTMRASDDMEDFARFMAAQDNPIGLGSSHDPAFCHLTADNAFWIWLEDEHGERVASASQKFVRTRSFIGEILSHRLFDSRAPVLDAPMPDLLDGAADSDFDFAGNVVYGSGLFVHPRYRGRGFILLGRISRSLALRHFDADYLVGIQAFRPGSDVRALKAQRYANFKPALDGIPHRWGRQFQIAWSSRAEWLQAIRAELRDVEMHRAPPSPVPLDRTRAAAAGGSSA